MRVVALVLVVLATACGPFTDDPFSPTNVEHVVASEEGRTLSMFIGTCDRHEVEIEETDDEVRISARGTDDPGAGCFGESDVRVELDAPLGDRTVISAYEVSFDPGATEDVHRCGVDRGQRRLCQELAAG